MDEFGNKSRGVFSCTMTLAQVKVEVMKARASAQA